MLAQMAGIQQRQETIEDAVQDLQKEVGTLRGLLQRCILVGTLWAAAIATNLKAEQIDGMVSAIVSEVIKTLLRGG